MEEKNILEKLLSNNKITKDEYEKLLRDFKLRNQDSNDNNLIMSILNSMKDDIYKVKKYVFNKEIDEEKINYTYYKVKQDIIKEFDKRKIKKISKKNNLKKYKEIPVREQKILHKINKNINSFNVDILSDYVTVIGTKKKELEVTSYFYEENMKKDKVLKLIQSGEKLMLRSEDNIKGININVIIKIPYNYLKNISITCKDTTYDFSKLDLSKLEIKAFNSYLNIKNNKINSLDVKIKKVDCRISKFIGSRLNMEANLSKIKIDSKTLKDFKLNLNNCICKIIGVMKKNNINIKIENMFSKISYNKKKFNKVSNDANITYLYRECQQSKCDRNIECKLITSKFKIC